MNNRVFLCWIIGWVLIFFSCEKRNGVSPLMDGGIHRQGVPSLVYDSYDWQVSDPEDQNIDSGILAQAFDEAEGGIPHISSILIIRGGYLVAERYFQSYDKTDPHDIQTASAAFLTALVGIALEEGFISSLDVKVVDLLPEYVTPDVPETRHYVTIRHLIEMTPAFEYESEMSGLWASTNWTQWSIQRPAWLLPPNYITNVADERMPGRDFMFSFSATHLLSAILTRVTGMSTLAFARDYLCDPLSISIAQWDVAPEGVYKGGLGMYMTPRDMARFGHLYMNNGILDGRQIVPSGWVEESLQDHLYRQFGDRYWWGYLDDPRGLPIYSVISEWGYGYCWRVGFISGYRFYAAMGESGQFIVNLPELDMIIVTTADNREGDLANHQADSILELVSHYILSAVWDAHAPPPFRPLNLSVSQQFNRSMTQGENVHYIRWEPNPLNENTPVSRYSVYKLLGGERIYLGESVSGVNEFFYRGREIMVADDITYGVSARTDDSRESLLSLLTFRR